MSSVDLIEELRDWCQALGYNFDLSSEIENVDVTSFGASTMYRPSVRTWRLKIAGREIEMNKLSDVVEEGKRAVLEDLRKISA